MTTTAFATTLEGLADASQPLKLGDLNGLSNARRADVQLFAERWPTIPVQRRREIVRGMGDLIAASFEVEFTPLSRVALSDPDVEVRATAIENLWESEAEDLIQPYLTFLSQDEGVSVRAAAAGALGKYMFLAEMEELDEAQAALVRRSLLTTIRDPREDIEVRRRAIESIGFLGDEEVRAVIEDAYNSPDDVMQASAVTAMGRSLDQYWSGMVLLELANPNPRVRLEAVLASGELELRQAVPALVDLLEEPNRAILLATLHALGQIGGPVARQALEMMAESDDEEIAQEAEDALAELQFGSGDDWLVYDLNAASLDPDSGDFGDSDADDEMDELDGFSTLWRRTDDEFDD